MWCFLLLLLDIYAQVSKVPIASTTDADDNDLSDNRVPETQYPAQPAQPSQTIATVPATVFNVQKIRVKKPVVSNFWKYCIWFVCAISWYFISSCHCKYVLCCHLNWLIEVSSYLRFPSPSPAPTNKLMQFVQVLSESQWQHNTNTVFLHLSLSRSEICSFIDFVLYDSINFHWSL